MDRAGPTRRYRCAKARVDRGAAHGPNAETGTAGEMTDVIRHSLQNLPDSDLDAMVVYLRALAPNGCRGSSGRI